MSQIYTIKNNKIEVKIHSKGAQLWSIKDKEGTEYLWQGDAKYWKDRAINLFPYIARLTDGKYKLSGMQYHMDIHGFLKDSEMEVQIINEEKIVFLMQDSEKTREQYPFQFLLKIQYEVKDTEIAITFLVENKDTKKMFFGIGGHPGFNVPLEKGNSFEDYYLEFSEEAKAIRVGMSEDCFVTEEDTQVNLQENKILPLKHNIFDDDAIIMKNMAKEISLKSNKGRKKITLSFPKMNYLGIWHMPHTDAPYICIEPWTSLPSRKNVIEDLEKQENLIELDKSETYINMIHIKICTE